YRTVEAFPRRGEGERAAYNLGRLKATWLAEGEGLDVTHQALEPSLRFTAASRGGWVAPQLKLPVYPEPRRRRRGAAGPAGEGGARHGGPGGARRGAL